MRSAVSAALLACLALGACAHVRTPDLRLPQAYEAPKGAPAGAVELDRWWLAFDDAQLTGLIEQALIANPDARSAAARLTEARANRTEALVHFLPQGDVTASTHQTDTHQLAGTVFNFPGFTSSGVSNASAVNFDVSWEVDIFGRFLAARKAVNGDLAAARFNYEGARASLAASVADAYFQARGLAIQLADARETARIERELYDSATKRAAAGIAPTSDADRVAGDLAQADALAAGLEAELQAQRRTILILAGRTIEPTANIAVDASVGTLPPIPDALPSELLKRRPDVREAEARVAGQAGRSDADILAFLPTLYFTPSLGWQQQSQPGFSITAQSLVTGGTFTQPLLSIPKLLAELKAQNARTEQAVIAYEKAVQTAFSESEGALVRLEADRRRVALLTEGEARAARGYRASKIGYDRGLTDLQTALSAEQSWRTTRSQLTAAEVQALRRTVQAYKALGGGWPAERFPSQAQAR
ncbi:efflux transporter outer membrane subunit [Phenylobacterium sp.]|jgi:NodT family efflux transporter outer membrane factor (OMF) lipoprotein|uniref:efflux transporter outer membrane subunit n=1 Tax=Phenylobacterium sp. TaxID=1871053 RepID=UPI002E30D62F|nr:efflux transporter outer membrane subunit [Phenylobacterium sp.]HEX4710157.1 efflux transporter outer membrane subunit [Phenylobacterium sp.]